MAKNSEAALQRQKKTCLSNAALGQLKARSSQLTAKVLALVLAFVGYGEALAAFGTTTGQHVAAIGGFHAETEAVLVHALAL